MFFLLLMLIPWATAPFFARIPARTSHDLGRARRHFDPRPTMERLKLAARTRAIIIELAATIKITSTTIALLLQHACRRRPSDPGP